MCCRWGSELRELRVDVLSADLVPLVDAMPRLEVLHFEVCKRHSKKGNSRAKEPVFPARPADRGSLLELDALGTAPQKTMMSLMDAHRATLRLLRLPSSISGKKLE